MPRSFRIYGYTLCAVAASVLIRYLLDPWLGDQLPLLITFAAVVIVAWFGGWRAGVLASVVGYVACSYLFIYPRHTLTFTLQGKHIGIFSYFPASAAVMFFCEAIRQAWRRASVAEKAVVEQADMLRTTLSSIGDGIITTDTAGTVVYLNPGAEAITGWNVATAVGKPLDQVLAAVRENAGSRKIEDSTAPIRDGQGQITGSVHILRDITERDRAEKALRESEERWQLAVNSANDGIWDWNVVDDSLYWSPRCKEMLGYTDGELPEMTRERVRDLIHPEDRTRAWDNARKHLFGETTQYEDEYRLRHKDGAYRWVLARGLAMRDAEGKPARFVGSHTDITQRRRSELALRESERRLRLAQNAARVGTWELDLLNGDVYWSDGLWQLLGLIPQEEQATVERWKSHLHPDDREWVMDAFQEVLTSGKREFSFEFRVVRADGDVRWVTSKGQIMEDLAGRPIKAVGANQDITDHKRTEQALRESEQQIRLLTDVLPALIAYVDSDLRYRFNNRSYGEWFGIPPERTTGQHLRDVLGERAFQERLPYIEQVLRGESVRFEAATPHQHRGQIDCEVQYVPDCDEHGRTRGFVVLVQDITVRKHAEVERERLLASERAARAEAERASEAKSEFLATLSHELRTPLTPVLLTVSLIESHPELPSDLREDIASIRRNVELESRLIGDLLDLTRISKGKLQLEFQETDVHPIIRSAVEICQREASAQLMLQLSATQHMVRGDRIRLQQIFWNLINNAQKFTPPGGTITVRTIDLPNERVRIEVTDTGVGIDPAVLPKLFNAFEQGDVRVQRQQAGLGLGLAISRKLAEAHGGGISVRSGGRGLGATFAVDLPIVPAEASTIIPTVPMPVPAAASARALDVLLIEDHEPTLRVMTRLLSRLGHKVTGATTVATATAAARSGSYDLIISDLGLPDGSGLDLMREVREMYEGRAIALTGYGMESDVAASRAAGFSEHLTKPVDLEKLTAAISRVNCG